MKPPLTPEQKNHVMARARVILRRLYPQAASTTGHCLFAAAAVVQSLYDNGRRALVQAGTCQWPRLTKDQNAHDDEAAAFGYVWEPYNPKTEEKLSRGELPEMHCWAVDMHSNEIIDMCAGFFPAQCKALIGLDWPGIKPPQVFWHQAKEEGWPEGVTYCASPSAICAALTLLARAARVG